MGGRINTIMQAAFFKLADVIPYEQADEYMKAYAKKTYGKKGDEVVKKNWDAIDIAISGLVEIPVPAGVGQRHHRRRARQGREPPSTSTSVIQPILAQEGDKLPVSAFDPAGVVPTGTTKYEKRGIAVTVPEWQIDNCIQCSQCSLVCPHACIRPYHASKTRARPTRPRPSPPSRAAGTEFTGMTVPHAGQPRWTAPAAATASQVCPAKNKALVMKPLATQTARGEELGVRA